MINDFEKINKEKIVLPRIILKFCRHSIKEPRGTKEKKDVQLNQAGRKLARGKYNPATTNAVAFGSSYDRAQETALLVALGLETNSFDETKALADAGLNYGSKLGIDTRLDFKNSHETNYYQALRAACEDKKFLKFIVEDSDELAAKLNDKGGATYSRMAAQIAGVVKKYSIAINNWDDILENNPDKYDSSALERFLVTHRGLGESFVAKVIDKTSGQAERDKFVKALNNEYFSETEGFSVDIGKYNEEKIIHISFNKIDKDTGETIYSFEKSISEDLLEEIIKEGKMVFEMQSN